MADDISMQIGLSLGDTCQVIPAEYFHTQLLQEISRMFGKNWYILSSFNVCTESIPPGELLGNRFILEEQRHDKNIFREILFSVNN